MAQLDWDGDKGVENSMGIYIQYPSQNFINSLSAMDGCDHPLKN
jgi:hypothetical protein